MIDEKELLDLCDHAVTLGVEKGADQIEAIAQFKSELETEVEQGEVSSVNRIMGNEIAIRVFVEKRMGSAFTNIATKDSVSEAVSLALQAAKAANPDDDFVSLSKPSEYPSIPGLWNDSIITTDPGQVVNEVVEIVKRGASHKDLVPAMASSGANAYLVAYANNNGVRHAEKTSIGYGFLAAIAKTESGVTPMVFAVDIGRGLDIRKEAIVHEVAEILDMCKKEVMGKSGRHTVVFHPRALLQLLQYTLVPSIKGENVARGKSKIGDKIGEQIASEKITLYDDGTHPKGIASSIADDEGVARQKTTVIDRGVLRSFLWDTYWGNRMGVSSTGNASRNMREGLIEIKSTNIVIEPGTRSIENIISDIDYGYYIQNVQGAHSSNPESGDFSIVGNPAILIEDGKKVGQVHGLMVSGNAFDLLKQVGEIAKEPHYLQGIIAPEIVFSDTSIIAKE
ncbi:TldD/PmbA family protein [Candidatus Thorarchaeota archaeon]|nr:MAG: TldD/PmbA family protein [Candidatus Thorarchaeota archaeon]